LGIDSSLTGVTIDLPAPMGKTSQTRRPLELQIPLGGNGPAGMLRYDDLIAARFSADGRRIGIGLNEGLPELPGEVGLFVGGQIPLLDMAAWQATLQTLGRGDDRSLPPLTIDVGIDRLLTPVLDLDAASVRATHRDAAWDVEMDAVQLAGSARVPATLPAEPLIVALERLELELPLAESSEATPIPDPTSAIDPTGMPGLNLSVDALSINQANLGALSLKARHTDAGLILTEFQLVGGAAEASAEGRWIRDADRIETTLEAELSTEALGDLLVDLGYARQLEEGPAVVDIALSWPGDPGQIHSGNVRGFVGVAIEGGRLVELDPGVTRVVGLLNLNALARRLRLDFSDLFEKGYSFYSVDGVFDFNSGTATTDNLVVLGPSGRIDLSGSTDLLARTLDQQVRVTPDFDATLPIASAIAGGPVAGVAVLVAQQLMSEQVDEINRFEYRLSGPWAAPEIEQLDTGGALSRLFKGPAAPDSTERRSQRFNWRREVTSVPTCWRPSG
jgi:uncharacterized protein YhdP